MNLPNKLILCSLIAFHSTAYCSPYVSGQIGAINVTFGFSTPYNSYEIDKTALLTRLAVGYLWSENGILQYGIEAGFQNLHHVEATSYQITLGTHQYQIDTVGVIDYYFCRKWDVFAKAGAAYNKRFFSVNYQQESDSGSLAKLAPKAVLGIGYNLTQHVNLNLSWEKNFKTFKGSDLLAGIKYTF